MTTTTKSIAVTCLLALGLSANSFAQQMYASNTIKTQEANNIIIANENSSKKIDDVADPLIVNKFSILFPNATNMKWVSSVDNVLVTFLNNGRKANACFTAKGELNYVITDCSMEQLPADFSKSIKMDYTSYHLFNAKEITTNNSTVYQAVLENAKGFITIKYSTDGIEVIQQVRKSGN